MTLAAAGPQVAMGAVPAPPAVAAQLEAALVTHKLHALGLGGNSQGLVTLVEHSNMLNRGGSRSGIQPAAVSPLLSLAVTDATPPRALPGGGEARVRTNR